MGVVVWGANHVELDMQYGKSIRKTKSINSLINLVSRFLIWTLNDLIYLKIQSIMVQIIIEYGHHRSKMRMKDF